MIPNSKERGNKTARVLQKKNNGTVITTQRRGVRTTPRTNNAICMIPAPAASYDRIIEVVQCPFFSFTLSVHVRQRGHRRTLYLLSFFSSSYTSSLLEIFGSPSGNKPDVYRAPIFASDLADLVLSADIIVPDTTERDRRRHCFRAERDRSKL